MVSAWNISWPGEEDVEHFWSVCLSIPGLIADMTNGEYLSLSLGEERLYRSNLVVPYKTSWSQKTLPKSIRYRWPGKF